MATVEELRGQLEDDKARLRSLTWVNWGGRGCKSRNDRLLQPADVGEQVAGRVAQSFERGGN